MAKKPPAQQLADLYETLGPDAFAAAVADIAAKHPDVADKVIAAVAGGLRNQHGYLPSHQIKVEGEGKPVYLSDVPRPALSTMGIVTAADKEGEVYVLLGYRGEKDPTRQTLMMPIGGAMQTLAPTTAEAAGGIFAPVHATDADAVRAHLQANVKLDGVDFTATKPELLASQIEHGLTEVTKGHTDQHFMQVHLGTVGKDLPELPVPEVVGNKFTGYEWVPVSRLAPSTDQQHGVDVKDPVAWVDPETGLCLTQNHAKMIELAVVKARDGMLESPLRYEAYAEPPYSHLGADGLAYFEAAKAVDPEMVVRASQTLAAEKAAQDLQRGPDQMAI